MKKVVVMITVFAFSLSSFAALNNLPTEKVIGEVEQSLLSDYGRLKVFSQMQTRTDQEIINKMAELDLTAEEVIQAGVLKGDVDEELAQAIINGEMTKEEVAIKTAGLLHVIGYALAFIAGFMAGGD